MDASSQCIALGCLRSLWLQWAETCSRGCDTVLYASLRLKGDLMLIFRSIILFWVTARTGVHAFILKKHPFFLKILLPSCLFKTSFLNTLPALIGQLAHVRASNAHYPFFSGWLCRVFGFQLASLQAWLKAQVMQMCDMDAVWCQDYWQGYFRSSVSVGKRSFCSRSFICRRTFITLKEQSIMKKIIGRLISWPIKRKLNCSFFEHFYCKFQRVFPQRPVSSIFLLDYK